MFTNKTSHQTFTDFFFNIQYGLEPSLDKCSEPARNISTCHHHIKLFTYASRYYTDIAKEYRNKMTILQNCRKI